MVTGDVRGRHYTEWVETVKALKRDGRLDEAEALVLECVVATELEAIGNRWPTPAPWYYSELAIIYRKRREPENEQAILQRYVREAGRANAAANTTGRKLLKRLDEIAAATREA